MNHSYLKRRLLYKELTGNSLNELQTYEKSRIRTHMLKISTDMAIEARHNELKANLKRIQNVFIAYE